MAELITAPLDSVWLSVSFDRIIGASARIYADHFPRFRQANSAIKSGETSVSLEDELLVVAFSPKWEGNRHFMRYSHHFIWLKSKAACVAHSRYLSRAHAPGYLAETFPFSVSTEAKGGEIFVSESAKKQLRQVMSQSRFFRNQGCKRLQAHVCKSFFSAGENWIIPWAVQQAKVERK
jgi:hypothetical protein